MQNSLISLENLLTNVVDNRGKTCPTEEAGISLIATNCIHNEFLYPTYEKVRYVSKDTYENWFRGHPESGDIIFVLKGDPGRCALVPEIIDFCIAQDMVALRFNSSKVYNWYMLALLRSKIVRTQISNMHVGTMIPHFKKGDFKNLLLPVPSLPVQNKIGNIYRSISLKTENNRRICEKLEEMAQAIFKQWFVEQRTDEWEETTVGDLVRFNYGKALIKENRIEGNIPVYSSAGLTGYHNSALVNKEGIVVGRKGTIGTIFRVFEPFYCIDTAYYITEEDTELPLDFVLYMLKTLKLDKMNEDSAVPGLNRNLVYSKTIYLPGIDSINNISKTITSIINKIRISNDEIGALQKTRDTLLPKLMSGEIDLEDEI